ncbi:transporter, BCCT family protein [Pseudooceanicola batsensis HTCC2597]|uniref:Transporter, BCCT family protein n=1 Tax=Pseudooceanicola batsensis (strain ATCC BAA-863 / DSM 15984 / KCTC 12145 / HTCC2597) TaxID=252305 RepID=A3U2K8_PSEBH|nr:BCCT family transporter [Pseudooceanicola batsensis]EAQ01582.1 transporter, BCCT family protein [Pseudooceanicola batsensis HTCC2597]
MTETSDETGQGIPAPEGASDLIDTDYEIGQDNIDGNVGPFGFDIHNPVFLISGLAIVAFVFYTLALPDQAGAVFSWLFSAVTKGFDWFFLGAANLFVIFCLLLIVTPLGSVRLGGADATPDYSYIGWFAMLFAAGMGIGLMFYGVSEPMSHFSSAMGGTAVEGGARTDWAPLGAAGGNEQEAIRLGMAATIFHWGLHPWAIYAVVALALALFTYNKGLPLTIRSAFYPLLGERVWGWWGHLIDTLAVFATLFGLATSLGFGATQANAGLNELFGVPVGATTEVILISAITAIALISVVRGLDGGVKVLSELNMGLAALLLLFVLFVGPTVAILTGFVDYLVAYVQYLPALSNPVGREDVNFSQGWTSFYWAWWISWSPFVGMFIARVSRGRSVREFVICVLLIPSLVCVLWMSVFGGTAIQQVVQDGYTAAQDAPLELKLFKMLEQLPLAGITSLVGIILVIVFFVTSSDSGSLVIDTITAGGKVDAPVPQRVFWCIFEGAVAIVLLLSAGGLASLQSMVISTGLPFTVVLLIMCYAIYKGLAAERQKR